MNRVIEKGIRIVDILLTFALAITVVILGYYRFWQSMDAVLLALLLILGGLLSLLICTALHEFGHVIFGLCCGFRFNSMRIGFMNIHRKDGKLRITFSRLPESLAGATEMLPRNAEKLYSRFLLTISGGLIFSFIVLAAACVVLFLYPIVPFAAYIFVGTALPFAFHIFFYNVLPFNDDNLDTDGGMLRGLLKKSLRT